MRWTFGVEPLAQTCDAASLLRDVTSLVLSLEEQAVEVDVLIGALRTAKKGLGQRAPADVAPRVGAMAGSSGRVYLDHSRDIGSFNPCFPPYEIAVEGDRASGQVEFPLAYEGPPGLVHGGFLSLFFDCIFQHHSCDLGIAGKTTELTMRYRRPTPVVTKLDFEASRSIEGGRIQSSGRILLGGVELCGAKMTSVAGDLAALPTVSPRRHTQ